MMSENPLALKPNTIIRGRYLVGELLGQGGFAMTYAGHDLALDIKVAIKEYFPMGIASRSQTVSNQMIWNSTQVTPEQWQSGCDDFLKEARRMAKIDSLPGIVRVRDTFPENNTAYIVMDYIEGPNLKEYLRTNGTMSASRCLELFVPLMESLEKIHKKDLIHRDISPDNIMLQPDGTLCLLDFGAAKDISFQKNAASKQVAKKGFSPPEQYMDSGIIGPWTDVYALCATMYYCITGKVVPDAMERVWNDTLEFPKDLSIGSCLKKGLELRSENRIASVGELLRELTGLATETTQETPKTPVKPRQEESVKVEPVKEVVKAVESHTEIKEDKLQNDVLTVINEKVPVWKRIWFMTAVSFVLFFIAVMIYDRAGLSYYWWNKAIGIGYLTLFLSILMAVLAEQSKLFKYKKWFLGIAVVLQLFPVGVSFLEMLSWQSISNVPYLFWVVCCAILVVCYVWTCTQVLREYSKTSKILWIPSVIIGAVALLLFIINFNNLRKSYFISLNFIFWVIVLLGTAGIALKVIPVRKGCKTSKLKNLGYKKIGILSLLMYIAVFVLGFVASILLVQQPSRESSKAFSEGSYAILVGIVLSIASFIMCLLPRYEKIKNKVVALTGIINLIPMIWIMNVNRYMYGVPIPVMSFIFLCVIIALVSMANAMMLFDYIGLKWSRIIVNVILGCTMAVSAIAIIVYLIGYLSGTHYAANYIFWLLTEIGFVVFALVRRNYRRRMKS